MPRSAVTTVLFLVAFVAILPSLSAQQPGEAPRFLLNSGGASQPLQSLRFSPDGTRLYAAGDHKCVHVWRVPARPMSPSLETSLHWEISRANLGRIFSMDLSPSGQKLVIGGYSAFNRGGDLALFDVPGNKYDRPLPAADRTEQDMTTSGHISGTNGTSFSLDGKHLATIGAQGDVLIWSVAEGRIIAKLVPASANVAVDSTHRLPVLYLANGNVVAPVGGSPQVTPRKWSLSLFEPGRNARVILPDVGTLVTLARDPSGQQWASLHEQQPHIRIFNQTGQSVTNIHSGRGKSEPSGLALGGGNLVLVAEQEQEPTDRAYYNQLATGWVQLWDGAANPPTLLDEVEVSTFPVAIACAISPDGRWAATVAGSGEDIWLYSLVDAQGRRLAKPLSGQDPVVLRGRGSSFWNVAFEETDSADGKYRIGFGVKRQKNITLNDYADVTSEFDLVAASYIPQENAASRWRKPNSGAADWTVELQESAEPRSVEPGTRLRLLRNGQNAGEILLDRAYQGRCISYCWIPRPNQQLPALAIGTGGASSGIFVYELNGTPNPRLVRYFRDHQFWVTSLSVSRDGKYLASASRDQTIKIWSLAGLYDHPARFSNACAWGAELVAQGNQLVVQNVQLAGVVASRGLRNGDAIKAVNRRPVTNPQETAKYLNGRPIWETQGIQATGVRDGKALAFEEFAITPAWEPLLSLFLDRNQEWAVWTPRGYYDSSPQGDKLFGWLINRKRGEAPLFFRSDQLRQDMERPDVIKQVLITGNIDSALKAAGEQVRIPELNPVRDVAVNKIPTLRISSPPNKAHFQLGQPVVIVAKAEFPAAVAPTAFKPLTYLNSAPISSPPNIQVGPGPRQVTYTWTIEPTSVDNTILVRLDQGDDAGSVRFVSDQIAVTADIKPSLRRMYFFGLSGQEYVSSPLSYTHKDVAAIQRALEENQGTYYDLNSSSDIRHLKDTQITGQVISDYADELQGKLAQRGKLAQEDLLVVAVSGHGVVLPSVRERNRFNYFFIQPHPEIKSLAADRNDVKNAIRKHAIQWDVFVKLAELPCKKMFLLDTCHSGAAGKGSTRSLDTQQAFVLASARANEKSYESRDYEHGIFTYCLLKGLEGDADGIPTETGTSNLDENVDIFELAKYVSKQTAALAYEKLELPQNPEVAPTSYDPDAVFQFPLVPVRSTKTTSISP